MRKYLLIVVVSFFCNIGISQRIHFCKNYTETGEPISPGSIWTISGTGGNVYILFQNGGKSLNVNSVTYYIDKLSSSSVYLAFDSKYITADPSKTWNVLDFKFTAEGDYRVKVLLNLVEVATEYVTIKSNALPATPGTTTASTDAYVGSSITAGTDITLSSGFVHNQGTSFNLNAQSLARVYFKVSNGTNRLNTTKLIVDIYKMNNSGTYDFYVTKNYDISDLNWVYFSYDFYLSGSYKVNVYNGTSAWINTAYVTIYGSTVNTASGNNTNNYASSTSVKADYYVGSSIIAGTDIDLSSGYVYGAGGTFKRKSIINKKVKIYFKVSNGSKSINTSKLIVDIWKKNRKGIYDVYRTTNYDIANSSHTWIYFTYEFVDDGDYKVMVYNANSAWINTSYFKVD
jgi:hypothetical protein